MLLDGQSASQPASCSWPATQPCAKVSTCQTLGWSQLVAEELGGLTTFGPSPRVSALPLVLLGGVTQMSSGTLYITLALLTGTVCSFVSTSPNHIFLHQMLRNAIKPIFCPEQLYTYPSTINLVYYYTKVLLSRNYFYPHK